MVVDKSENILHLCVSFHSISPASFFEETGTYMPFIQVYDCLKKNEH